MQQKLQRYISDREVLFRSISHDLKTPITRLRLRAELLDSEEQTEVFNQDLTITDYLMVILTATLASIGTAGVPGVGLIMLAMVLEQVGLPVEGIALIIGVDRLLDMTRTAVNVTGDSMVTVIVGKSEKQFDEAIYLDADAGIKIEEIDFHHLKD